MALINRISQLFKADFHAVLDHIEEPEQLLRQAVRDMEDELATCERRVAICSQEQEGLEARRHALETTLAELAEQLELCFASGKDDLARSTIRRKLEAERLGKRIGEKLEANARFLEKEGRKLEQNRSTLESLRQKAELFVGNASETASEPGSNAFQRLTSECAIAEDEIEIAFLREKSARSAS